MSNRVYVGKLAPTISEEDLRAEFSRFGTIHRLDLKMGFAFLVYDSEDSVLAAIEGLNGKEIKESVILVEAAHSSGTHIPDRRNKLGLRVLIHDTPERSTWQDLKDWGRGAGVVTYANVFKKNGERYGVVEYETKEEVAKALRVLPDLPLNGANISVSEDTEGISFYDYRPSDRGASRHEYGGRGDPFRGGGYDARDYRDGRDRDGRGERHHPGDRGSGRDYGAPRGGSMGAPYDRDYGDSRGGGYGSAPPSRYSYPPTAAAPYADYDRRDYPIRGGGYDTGYGRGGGYSDDYRREPSPPPPYYDDRERGRGPPPGYLGDRVRGHSRDRQPLPTRRYDGGGYDGRGERTRSPGYGGRPGADYGRPEAYAGRR